MPPDEAADMETMREAARRLMRANEVNPDPNASMVIATAVTLGLYAARRAAIPSDFVLLFMGILLLFMVGTQYLSDKRARGEPLLPKALRRTPSDG